MKRPPLTDIQTDNIATASYPIWPTTSKKLDAPGIQSPCLVNNLAALYVPIPGRHLYTAAPMLANTAVTEDHISNATPMNSADYLGSPIDTLLQSAVNHCGIAFHDLADAYATLSTRIRSRGRDIIKCRPLSALRPLKEHSNAIHQCLYRDIRRALVDPFSVKSLSSTESTTPDIANITEEKMRHAREQSVLCHLALRLLCDLLRFPALYSVFSGGSADSPLSLTRS
jgi:hypothetical protein